MASNLKEKLQIVRKDDIKCRELLKNFKIALNLWFICGTSNDVLHTCVEIILHGLKCEPNKLQMNTNLNALADDLSPSKSAVNNNKNCNSDLNELHKVIDYFEWVCDSVRINRNFNNVQSQRLLPASGMTSITSTQLQLPILSHVAQWLRHNLSEENLCGFIQYLVNEKELLEDHYQEEALLRQKKYVKIFVIGLTAFESQQYGLINQIDALLKDDIMEAKQRKRSNSQPSVILLDNTKPIFSNSKQSTSISKNTSVLDILTIRKTQSVHEFINNEMILHETADDGSSKRLRFKSIGTIRTTSPQNIQSAQLVNSQLKLCDSIVTDSPSRSSVCTYDANQPNTSQASSSRSKSPLSNDNLISYKSATSSSMSTSASSFSSSNTTKCIQLINTDDIKIWTDSSWELKQKTKQQKPQETTTLSCAIPTPITPTAKPCKSLSPINSFFSSLFSTPPSYTSWFIDHDSQTEQETTETAIESIIPDNNFQNRNSFMSSQQQSSSLSLGSTVFDTFLPIDGKKVRSRKTQSIFDDVSTTLECSGINVVVSANNTELPSSTLSNSTSDTSKNCLSLARFLQMSHLSRNNTDLEKENAHFRISEAIISAIEHMKWNKLETQKEKSSREATPLATDCLASPNRLQSTTVYTTSSDIIEGEHIPFAELEEVSYDLLSAEVVGLSLISKFDEKHLPKVSELKWLVSDDDTPQKLLPMPDLSSSANPDDHVITSATRGTRYWAPPRQQIIFTDHPSPNRKELLKKQNYRCAGCGMRVSPEYMQGFRYCTYLGKYHCTGCHRNQISAIPAKILQAWDFKCYPVSVFAYRLLEQMYAYPLFYVPDLNPALYVRYKALLSARNKRLQLKYVKDFIKTCRFALREQSYFESVPDYITTDIDNWSMSDFIDARKKSLHRSIDELINICEHHIFNCVLCTARGFLCEYCHADVVIYPWGSRVERCAGCGTCFHRYCWKSMSENCYRCQRIDKRRDDINDVT